MKKRLKILIVFMVAILIVAMLAAVVQGNDTAATLDENRFMPMARNRINKHTNVYCIKHNQLLGTSIANALEAAGRDPDGEVYFEAVATVVINGNKANFTNYYPSKGQPATGETICDENNIMAAIVSMKDDCNFPSCNKEGYGEAGYKYTCMQMGVYFYYNTWFEATGASDYGFEKGNGNDENSIGYDQNDNIEKGNSRIEKATIAAQTNNYKATIHFLKYKPSNNDGIEINNIQDLILVEPEEPTPKEIKVPVEKVWDDEGNEYNNRPDSIIVKLFADGVDTGKTLELTSENQWKGEFTKLAPETDDGKEIVYTIEEISVSGYTTTISGNQKDGFIITNILDNTSVPVEKIWEDDENRDGLRPTSIEVVLHENGEPTSKKVVLSEENDWKYTFTGLPKHKNGVEVVYTVKESEQNGYVSTITGNQTDGYIITNTHEPEKTDIEVLKVWDDQYDLDRYRPDSIIVTLYANGEPTEKTVTLSKENNWTHKFEDLFRYENGTLVNYTVQEEIVSEYEVTYTRTDKNATEDSNAVITYIITNKHEVHYDGYIEISGKVWLDCRASKENDINGVFGSEDTPMEGIKVTLKDKEGNVFDGSSPVYTNSDGTYIIKVNYDNSQNVYKLYQDADTVNEKIKTAYVEFEYNGIKYTTIANATAGENTSKAKEDEKTRVNLDESYSKVTPETVYPDSKIMTAATKDIISFETYQHKITETRTVDIEYCNGNGTYIHTNPNGAWNDIIRGTHTCTNCTGEGHSTKIYDVEVQKIENVNLGLFEREQPDVAIISDLAKVDVTMLGQKYTYLYNVRSNENNNVGLQAKFQNKDTYTYKRPVNPANIAYVNDGHDDAMSVLVTYEVKVANLSTTLPVTIHNIINSYDSRYTLNTDGWTVTNNGQFNQATSGDLNITVNPGKESDVIQLTYTVSIDAIKSLLKEDATLNNAVEIGSYSTKYGETTLYAEQQTGGRAGQPYGGYDYNSHPGNAGIFINNEGRLEAAKLEDDTDIAPSFVLCKDEETTTLSGTVWEDSDADNGSGPNNFRVGDGALTDADNNKKVANVKAELYKVNEDGTTELAQLYNKGTNANNEEIDAVTYTDNEGNYSFGDDNYGVVTDVYMIKFTYGDAIEKDGSIVSSTIDGVKINARNYKSTIISQENVNLYDVFKGTSTSDEWHLNMNDGYSIAVDDMETRLQLEDLQYSNFDDPFNMVAYSKTFKMQLEFDPSTQKTGIVGSDGKTIFGNDLSVFDFGIIERAREDIFVETTVDYLKITLANGQVLTEGKPGEEMAYAKAIGFAQSIENGTAAKRALDKQMIVEIDSELLQGAQLEAKYAIKVTNKSEKEYDYYVGNEIKTEYYYFGTNEENAPEIKGSVNYLVDYLDAELNYTWENAGDWTQVTAADLSVEGQELVSPATLEKLNSGKYVAYATTKYSELSSGETSETDYITAKKVLANKDDNIYDNHAEILKINAKVARTIKGKDENGTPVVKDYKPGNYVPSLESRTTVASGVAPEQAGMHEQDDDRVKITITPPTGATNYIITYVIVGLVGLIVIVLGVMFIKKKVLTK